MSGTVIRRLLLVGLAFGTPIACSDDGGMTPSDPTDPGALGLPRELDARREDVDAVEVPAADEHAVTRVLGARLARVDSHAQCGQCLEYGSERVVPHEDFHVHIDGRQRHGP